MALPQESRGLLERAGAQRALHRRGQGECRGGAGARLAEMRCTGEPHAAGGESGNGGQPVACRPHAGGLHRFAQRDMDVSGMGLAPGVTPFDDDAAGDRISARAHAICRRCCARPRIPSPRTCTTSTGDVVDMEAFALARVCLAENARFACVKYVTDGADSDSATHWEAALDDAARAFARAYSNLSDR